MADLKQLAKNYKKAVSKLQKELQSAAEQAIAEVFEQNPMLDAFSWRQYTDYFNDGDPCEFGVHSEYGVDVVVDGTAYEYLEVWGFTVEEGFKYPDEDWHNENEAHRPALKAAFDIVSGIGSIPDVALAAYGDHARVTIKRSGDTIATEVDDYSDHD